MPKLHQDGTLVLSSDEVKDLRASIYGYGLDITRGRDSEAALKLLAIRSVLLTLTDKEDD